MAAKGINEVGNVYGNLRVVSLHVMPHKKEQYWDCNCICGEKVVIKGSHLRGGFRSSCGCARYDYSYKAGDKFNKLTFISYEGRNKHNQGLSKWLCDCGKMTIALTYGVKNQNTRSCGCLKIEWLRSGNMKKYTSHNLSKHPFYKIWSGIKKRCSPKADPKIINSYYGRGIRLYDDWKGVSGVTNFINYIETELGSRPSPKHSLDRIDNDGNYEPGNLRWATPKLQRQNQRKSLVITSFTDEEITNEYLRRKNLKNDITN